MDFRIADTFTDSLSKLNNEEKKVVKIKAIDLQMNLANPGAGIHKIRGAKDPRFWSARVNDDIRIIFHKTDQNIVLCYVDHHKKAYDWASKHKLETHPKTGAAQFVEIPETVKDHIITEHLLPPDPVLSKPALFADVSEEDLLNYGVPPKWLEAVRNANEDTLMNLADHLPNEAADALLNLAYDESPDIVPTAPDLDPFDHPDAQIRFRKTRDREDLKRALTCPWGKNAASKIAYVMSRFDYPLINEILKENFNQTGAFEYLAQKLNVKATTLRNYRDRFDPYVKQEKSNRRGWWQVKLTDEFRAIKDEYDKKDREAIKHEIEGILSVQPSLETPVPPASPDLEIIYFPNDEISFKKLLLQTKRAYILLHMTDGTTALKEWNAPKFGDDSNVGRNLRSGYLRNWKQKGIFKAEISTKKEDLEPDCMSSQK